jgi:hypothetical protein
MAKQADTFGFDNGQAWAFGRGAKPVPSQPVPVDHRNRTAARPSDYQQPAVFLSVFPSGDQTAAHRDVWDQLPAERRRRGRRYVGKHRA